MDAIRISKRLLSDTLYLPELRDWVGKDVEIVVRELHHEINDDSTDPFPLRGSILRDDDPFGPALAPEEWEANR